MGTRTSHRIDRSRRTPEEAGDPRGPGAAAPGALPKRRTPRIPRGGHSGWQAQPVPSLHRARRRAPARARLLRPGASPHPAHGLPGAASRQGARRGEQQVRSGSPAAGRRGSLPREVARGRPEAQGEGMAGRCGARAGGAARRREASRRTRREARRGPAGRALRPLPRERRHAGRSGWRSGTGTGAGQAPGTQPPGHQEGARRFRAGVFGNRRPSGVRLRGAHGI